jgi:hypothetical protein
MNSVGGLFWSPSATAGVAVVHSRALRGEAKSCGLLGDAGLNAVTVVNMMGDRLPVRLGLSLRTGTQRRRWTRPVRILLEGRFRRVARGSFTPGRSQNRA